MIVPRPAIVRPRVSSPVSGEVLPIDEAVANEVAAGSRIIQISGGPATGKTTALAHLAATLPPAEDLVFLDDPTVSEVATHASRLRVICASRQGLHRRLS
jgi:type IV secretory pathway ATPase VirB11/archaellum biosynthesis ATPase